MKRFLWFCLFALLTLSIPACSALLGFDDFSGPSATDVDGGSESAALVDSDRDDDGVDAVIANVDAGRCGHLSERCCSGACDDSTLACIAGFCRPETASDTGMPCTLASDCQRGICLPVGQPVDRGPGWTGSVCTQPCATDQACLNGWACGAQSGVTSNICKCSYASETCNSADDDCDGTIDNEPAVDTACKQLTRSPLSICRGGACACGAATCNGACVDTATDSANCGSCGGACPIGASCSNSNCLCPANANTACSGTCVDLASDPNNCSACGTACKVTGQLCTGSTCTCPSSTPDTCAGACTNLKTDNANCGNCTHSCTANQTCSGGNCACNPGLTLCNGSACVDTNKDPANCGSCGHDCGPGAGCAGGKCQPVLLCSSTVTPSTAQKLVVDAADAFWTATAPGTPSVGYVASCSLGGLGVSVKPSYEGQNGIAGIARGLGYKPGDPAVVMWADENTGEIWTGPDTGGTPTKLASVVSSNPVGVTFDDTNWFWGAGANLVRLGRNGGTATNVIASITFPWEIAIDSKYAFAADLTGNQIVACPKTGTCGGSPIVIANGVNNPRTVTSDETFVYFGTQGTSANSYTDGAIYKCPVTGCSPTFNPTPFAAGQSFVQVVRVDPSGVYWFAQGKGLSMCPLSGCVNGKPVVLLPGVYATALALDATNVYYALGNQVMRLAK